MRNIFTLFAFCITFTLYAENILQNADWQKKSSAALPLQWQLRGSADGVKIEGNTITLGKKDQDIWLIQYLDENTTKGKKYELSYSASGEGVFRPYVEWQYIAEGKKKWRSSGAKLRKLNSDFKTEKIIFTLAEDSLRPYAVINVPKGNLVTLKNLKLVPYTEPLLSNADFSLKAANGAPVDWTRRGKAEQFSFADGKAVLKSAAGKNAYLIQNMKNRLLAGATYQASCKVSGKANSTFRCYVESSLLTNGQRSTRAFHHQWMILKDKEENITFKFTMGKTAVGALFVLNIKDESEVVFSDLKIELVSAPATAVVMEIPAEFTGSWQGKNIVAKSNHLTVFRNSNAVRKIAGLKTGKKYQLSHSSRGEGKSDSDSGFYFYDTFIRFTNGRKIRLAHEDTAKALQNKSYTFTAETATAEVEIVPLGADKLILREIQLRQAPADAVKVPELSFYLQRNTIYSKLPQKSVTGKLTNPDDAVSAKITFNGKNYDTVKSGKIFSFTLDTENLKTGSYDVSALLTAANGKTSIAKSKITVLPPAPVEVTVGQGRRFYVNGKAYFPVGLWSLPNMNNPSMLEFAAKHGINFIKTPLSDPVRTKKFLDMADKFGMKVCFNTGTPADESDGAYRSWLHSVESVLTTEVLNHPALFCYFLRDEPFWVGYPLKVLDRCHKELQRLDPYRPVWINAAPRGSYADQQPFAKLCDIYGVDIYPIPDSAGHSHLEDKTIACVGKYALRKAEIAGDTKPVAMALQGFSWRAFLDKKETPRSIYPTAHENRFMTFDCIINESALVSWWGNGYILTPEFYNVLFAQFDELRRLDSVLTESILSRRKETADGIEYRVFTGKEYKVIIAANASAAERKGTFNGEFSSDDITEWSAKRKIKIKNGKFSDTFAPYAVHIYFEGKIPDSMLAPANDPSLGNPFAETVKMRVNGRIYDGKACWIWEKNSINKVGSTAVIRKTFTVNGKANALIHVSADDQADIYCNGKKVGAVADWTFMHKFDLGKFLKDGENTLEIHAADSGMMPCGVIAELHINGTVYPTDNSWLAAKTPESAFAPAGIVAEFGTGVWGRGVRYCP